MELKLKRALKLRKELEAVLARPELTTEVSLSLLDNTLDSTSMQQIEIARTKFGERVAQYRQLSKILAGLRLNLATKNIESGIESLLSEIADVDREITMLRKITSAEVTPSAEMINAEIVMSRKELDQPKDAYSRPVKTVSFSAISEENKTIALTSVAELKRQREDLEEKRAWINSTTTVSVADADVELLRKLIIL